MSTVRFSKVIESCGKPEIFLLLNKDDSQFRKALKANRVMSLLGPDKGKTEFGKVGYSEKKGIQLLVFPKSLKRFVNQRVVGIRYDLFAGAVESVSTAKTPVRKKPNRRKTGLKTTAAPAKKQSAKPSAEPGKLNSAKMIPFPAAKAPAPDNESADNDSDLEMTIRQAMHFLEKGNSVAAYNVLKNSVRN